MQSSGGVNVVVSGRGGAFVSLVMVVISNRVPLDGLAKDLGFSARFAVEVKNTPPLSLCDSLVENGQGGPDLQPQS